MNTTKKKAVPEFSNIKEVLYNSAKMYKNNIAFTIKHKIDDNTQYENKTYDELLEDVNSFGASLYSLGLEDGGIAIVSQNRYEWAVAHLSNLLGGIVSVPLDKELQVGELESCLIRSKVKAVVFDGKHAESIKIIKEKNSTLVEKFICMDDDSQFISMKALINEGKNKSKFKKAFINHKVNSKEMSVLLFTSGTTSKSKAVMLNQEGIAKNISDMIEIETFKSSDVNLAFLPLHHILGSTGLLVMLASGMKTVFTDGIRYMKDNLKEYKVSVLIGVPAIIDKMCQGTEKAIKKQGKEKTVNIFRKITAFLQVFNIDIRRKIFKGVLKEFGGELRLIISGGASLDKEIAKNFSSFGIDIIQGYGLTETSPVIAAEGDKHKRFGSVGFPLKHVELKIANKDENGIGEIAVKGPSVMLGYYEDDMATKDVLKDGWFYTGDLGYRDKDGFVFITGRKKDVIVLKNGKKVFPNELEALISKIPEAEEVFVYGKPDENDSNNLTVSAKVVYDEKNIKAEYGEISREELYGIIWAKIKEINKTLPRYKYIKNMILTHIPLIKTTTNKIKRNEELKLIVTR